MEVEIYGRYLLVYPDGTVFWKGEHDVWKLIPNLPNTGKGYNQLQMSNKGTKKRLYRHRLIAWLYLGLDLDDKNQIIDHIDGDKINNCMENLRIVSSSQNSMNRIGVLGCSYIKNINKWRARIVIKGKHHFLGHFTNKEDAILAYKSAKLIHHIINGYNDNDINKYLIYNKCLNTS